MTCQAWPSWIRNMRSTIGFGTMPASPAPGFPADGATDGAMAAEAAWSQPCASIRASRAARSVAGRSASTAAGVLPLVAERISQRGGSCRTSSRARESPSHMVGRLGSSSRSPSTRSDSAGSQAASAGASTRAEPGSLLMRSAPARAASISPGTPSRLPASSSSGSIMRESSRRSSTSTCCRPLRVFRNTAPPRTVRSPPSTSAQDSSRDRNMCSNQCGLPVPGVSSAMEGLARSGARRCSASCQVSKNGRSVRICMPRKVSGMTRASTRRFSRAMAMPAAPAVRSASTIQCPFGPRIRSAA